MDKTGQYERRERGRYLLSNVRLENKVDDLLRHPIGDAEIGAGDCHEAEHDRCGLRDLATIGPLYSLKLGPAGPQERNRANGKRLLGLASGSGLRCSALRSGPLSKSVLGGAASATTPTAATTSGWNQLGRLGLVWALTVALRLDQRLLGLELLLDRHPAGATDERRIELIDVTGVRKRTRKIGAHRPICG
jgi:hypothetical protein